MQASFLLDGFVKTLDKHYNIMYIISMKQTANPNLKVTAKLDQRLEDLYFKADGKMDMQRSTWAKIIRISGLCPECRKRLSISASTSGYWLACYKCNLDVDVPASEVDSAMAAAGLTGQPLFGLFNGEGKQLYKQEGTAQ